jgi:hypothetical protein
MVGEQDCKIDEQEITRGREVVKHEKLAEGGGGGRAAGRLVGRLVEAGLVP